MMSGPADGPVPHGHLPCTPTVPFILELSALHLEWLLLTLQGSDARLQHLLSVIMLHASGGQHRKCGPTKKKP